MRQTKKRARGMKTLEWYKFLFDIKTDRNGYSDSIMGSETDKCFICGNTDTTSLVRHELFRGADRQKSKLFGLWVSVCPTHHELFHTKEYEREYHRVGQVAFMQHWKKADFIEIFGRNYL